MTFANVNIGSFAGDNTGDPLRTAFDKINKNFANIARGDIDITVNAPVMSVNGKQGNLWLNVNDIPGAIGIGAVTGIVNSANAASRFYTDTAINNLINGAPGTLDTLKEIADAINADEGALGGLIDVTNSTAQGLLAANASITSIQNTYATKSYVNDAIGNIHIPAGGNVNVSTVGSYVFYQSTPSSVWTINHGLNQQYLQIELIDSNNEAITGRYDSPTITFVDANTTVVSFTAATSGHAVATTGAFASNVTIVQGSGNVDLSGVTASINAANVEIGKLRANITAANTAITTANTAMKGYVDSQVTTLTANSATQETEITSLRANITAANLSIATTNTAITTANTGMKSYVDALNAHAYADFGNANVAMKGYVDSQVTTLNTAIAGKTTTTYVDGAISTAVNNLINSAPGTLDTLGEIAANLANQSSAVGAIVNSITSTNANVTAANAAIASTQSSINSVSSAWQANAATQETEISGLRANITAANLAIANINVGTTYSNANVTSYLPTHTGNVGANRVYANGYYWSNGAPFVGGGVSGGGAGNVSIAGAFVHTQSVASATWTIVHSLNQKYVQVQLINSDDTVMDGRYDYPTISYVDENTTVINFSTSKTGYAVVSSGSSGNVSVTNGNVFLSNVTNNITQNLVQTGNVTFAGQTISTSNASNQLKIKGYGVTFGQIAFNPSSEDISVTGNPIPLSGSTYNLGSSSYRWKDLYLSGNVNATNNILTGSVLADSFLWSNGAPYVPSTYTNSNVAAYLPTYTGNIAANSITLTGSLSVTGNVTYGNVSYGNLTVAGNITAQNYVYGGTGPVTISSANDLIFSANGWITFSSVPKLPSYTRPQLTSYVNAPTGGIAFYSNVGVPVYYDGTNWKFFSNNTAI